MVYVLQEQVNGLASITAQSPRTCLLSLLLEVACHWSVFHKLHHYFINLLSCLWCIFGVSGIRLRKKWIRFCANTSPRGKTEVKREVSPSGEYQITCSCNPPQNMRNNHMYTCIHVYVYGNNLIVFYQDVVTTWQSLKFERKFTDAVGAPDEFLFANPEIKQHNMGTHYSYYLNCIRPYRTTGNFIKKYLGKQ